ncbi:MAG: hypothetical protein GXP37_11085 [Chloroflexi bacterium]|nr:hypothetical protein [Chloroflexota bacterium]
MPQTKTLLELPFSSERAIAWVDNCLSRAGLSVMRSFDLESVRSTQEKRCPCPYHGTKACDCRLVVLLVYTDVDAPPVTLIVHGHDDFSWLETSESAVPTAIDTLQRIVQALGMEPLASLQLL